MQPLTSLRTAGAAAAAASVALVGVLAAAPQADAAVAAAAINAPHVLDHGKNLSVPLNASNDQTAADDAALAQSLADSLAGTWIGGIIDYATSHAASADAAPQAGSNSAAPATTTTCRATVTAKDPSGATGTASELVPAGRDAAPLTVPDQAAGTRWGVGDLDHFTLRFTCSAKGGSSQLSDVTIAEDAVSS